MRTFLPTGCYAPTHTRTWACLLPLSAPYSASQWTAKAEGEAMEMEETPMEHETGAQPQETPHTRWQRRMAARPLPPVQTTWGMEVAPLYTPEDIQHIDYARDLGYPGEFPFTRGVYPSMYRGRLWTMRQYAGFGSAAETNRRFRYLLDHGQNGLSVAFDLPTQMGYDADQDMARTEAGRVGVSISSVLDAQELFEGIP